MKLAELVRCSEDVADTRSRNQKRDYLAACLGNLDRDELRLGVSFLTGRLPFGRIGVGPAALRRSAAQRPALAPTLSIADVGAGAEVIASAAGKGSAATRAAHLASLFSAATEVEQHFLVRLFLGEVRQGALDGVMVEAVARAAECEASEVRRAVMLGGDLAEVADAVIGDGPGALARFRLSLGTPLQSMLAQSAETIEDAVASFQPAILDTKMDGARVQIHKNGGEVAVYSRRLNDISESVPELVELVRALPVDTALLDGETITLDADGTPHPFQTTMRRFGRKLDVAAMRRELPLSVFFFDCLHAAGEDLIDRPLRERLAVMDEFAQTHAMPRIETEDPGTAASFLAEALAAGHEGVMAKDPASSYEAGKRGKAWLKVKPAHTLDLVVLAAEWGHGRRRGWLSNLHLGALDETSGEFVMLGKTFKGLTDAMLTWQTKTLLDLEVAREGHVVVVAPRVVVEVAFNEVQTSPHYPSGLALRFARIKAFRGDKDPSEADTLETVRRIHARSSPKGRLR